MAAYNPQINAATRDNRFKSCSQVCVIHCIRRVKIFSHALHSTLSALRASARAAHTNNPRQRGQRAGLRPAD